MACGNTFEDSPRKEQQRAERAAEKQLRAIGKITYFFERKIGAGNVSSTPCGACCEVKKVNLILSERQLQVHHRGFAIMVRCEDPAALSAEFRNWIATDMTHVTKVEPRAH